jgi:hypothetical protein
MEKIMKKVKIYSSIILLLAFLLTSCEKWIDPDVNIDPNNPDDVTMDLLLPTIEGFWAYQLGGDVSLATRLWMQQLGGADRQALTYDRYTFNQSDVDNIWRFSSYRSSFMDTKILIDKATELGSPAYKGVAEVLWVVQFLNFTDLFGDVPYSEALQGDENRYPKFDSQLSILEDLDLKLDDAIINLAASSEVTPGDDDLIYGGDLDLWTKAAYALRARLYLHWGHKDASKLGQIQAAIDNSFESEAESMVFNFSTAANNSNPLYQFCVVDRPGYIYMGEYFVNMLSNGTPSDVSDDDPRLSVFVDSTGFGGYVGTAVGEPGLACDPAAYFIAPSAVVPFITYPEVKFIEAEINSGAARDEALKEGIRASLEMYGVLGADPAWEATNIDGIADATLEDVITAKYVGLALQLEIYSDYRRTGYPAIPTYQGQAIPVRYPYATACYNYNPDNVPTGVTKNTPIWWDSD